MSMKLIMSGSAHLPHTNTSAANTSGLAISLQWSIDDPTINLTSRLVTTTGDTRPNLVVRPGILRAGASYAFRLCIVDLIQDILASCSKQLIHSYFCSFLN